MESKGPNERAQDDVNTCILRMFEGFFSLDAAYVILLRPFLAILPNAERRANE